MGGVITAMAESALHAACEEQLKVMVDAEIKQMELLGTGESKVLAK